MKAIRALAALLALASCVSCMHAGAGGGLSTDALPPAADSVSVGLWRFDEQVGVRCHDAGPFRLETTAGPGTRTGYGRFGNSREFTRVIDSFAFAPYNPVMDPPGSFTVEAWVFPHAFGQYEDTPIASRWTQEGNQQSWLFGIVGSQLKPPAARLPSPGFHDVLVLNGRVGQLIFAFQPADASQQRSFVSSQSLQIDRWTHVAVSYDGQVVRFFFDGLLDSQYATVGRIQPSIAPLLVGNYFDVRRLTSFSGELRMEIGGDDNPYYAFEGLIDELRISNAARTDFSGAPAR